jgi:hypothetical protein
MAEMMATQTAGKREYLVIDKVGIENKHEQ